MPIQPRVYRQEAKDAGLEPPERSSPEESRLGEVDPVVLVEVRFDEPPLLQDRLPRYPRGFRGVFEAVEAGRADFAALRRVARFVGAWAFPENAPATFAFAAASADTAK